MTKGVRFVSAAIPAFLLYVLAFFHLIPVPFVSAQAADAILPVVRSISCLHYTSSSYSHT